MTAPHADLTGWSCTPFTDDGQTHDVYENGDGPGVVLMPEMPGIHPAVVGLAEHLVNRGFQVAMPSLFGTPGRPRGGAYMTQSLAAACVSREFLAFCTGAKRPVAQFIRALAADLNARTPGLGVGVIGMCFTGGFALAAAVDDAVLAAVLSQPAVPIGLTSAHKRDPGLSEGEFDTVTQRAQRGDLKVIGLRFSEDCKAPQQRIDTLQDRLGAAFEFIPLDSTPGNAHGFERSAHSVLTDEVREQPGHPAYEARKRVVTFLTERLQPR